VSRLSQPGAEPWIPAETAGTRSDPRTLFLPQPRAQGFGCGAGFRFLFALPLARREDLVLPRNFGLENPPVVGAALADHPVNGCLRVDGLQKFLELALRVALFRTGDHVADFRFEQPQDQVPRRAQAGVQIDRADQRLERVRKRGQTPPPAGGFLALAEQHVVAEMDRHRKPGQRPAGNHARAQLGQPAFREIRKHFEKLLRDDQLQDGVAEELHPLVIEVRLLRLVSEAGMSQRLRQ